MMNDLDVEALMLGVYVMIVFFGIFLLSSNHAPTPSELCASQKDLNKTTYDDGCTVYDCRGGYARMIEQRCKT